MFKFHAGLFSLLVLTFSAQTQVLADPLKEVQGSRTFKKVLGRQNIKVTSEKVYTTKWMNPGTFFGQVFLREEGYRLLFEWLSIPDKIYSPLQTTISKKAEYLGVERVLLDQTSKTITLTILIPHPRSREVVEQRMMHVFTDLIPTEAEIHSQMELELEGGKAKSYELEDGRCKIIYHGVMNSLLEAKVDHCLQRKSLEDFVKSLNLKLFDQRLQS